MYFGGIFIGLCTFIIIGAFHAVVIKTEYYFGVRAWPAFLAAGLLCAGGSLFVPLPVLSAVLSVLGFTCFWSIRELFAQRKRVEKGWFPENPNRPAGKASAPRRPSR